MDMLKILCFHGYRQNVDSFYAKVGSLRKTLKDVAVLDFVSAPHVPLDTDVPKAKDEFYCVEENGDPRAWWFSRPGNFFSYEDETDIDIGLQESVEKVLKLVKERGPYDGLMGFSQGASFVVLLAALRARKEIDLDFSFVILFCGFQSACRKHVELMNTKISGIYSMHVYGKNDRVVDFHKSEKLVSMFDADKSAVIIHDGGHFIPSMGKYKTLLERFLSQVPKTRPKEPVLA